MNTEPRGASGSASGETVSRASVLWGPISPEASRRAGSAFPTSSVLLRPQLPCGVAEAAIAVVPDAVLSRPDDTASTLRARLAQSSFLEDIHVLKGGRGPARVRLNATSYPQPRRRSWSHVVEEHVADQQTDDTCASLLSYTAYGRLPSDWEAVAMPLPVEDLGVAPPCSVVVQRRVVVPQGSCFNVETLLRHSV